MKYEGKQLAAIFEALANEHRRVIIYHLSLQPSSISVLANVLKLSLPAIHKHISVLEKAKFLKRKKSGRCNFLALNRDAFAKLNSWMAGYHSYWGNNNESLANYVKWINKT